MPNHSGIKLFSDLRWSFLHHEVFRWQALIDSGKFSNVHELARAIGKDDGYVSRIIRLTLLSPEIIHAIIAGTLEKDIGIEQLKQAMPLMWDEQKKMFGME